MFIEPSFHCGFVFTAIIYSSAGSLLLAGLTKVSSLRATLMLLLDRKERDRRLHKEISRTDCCGLKKEEEKKMKNIHFFLNEEKTENVMQDWRRSKQQVFVA